MDFVQPHHTVAVDVPRRLILSYQFVHGKQAWVQHKPSEGQHDGQSGVIDWKVLVDSHAAAELSTLS